MKVAVLGGAGLTGRCAVRALAESKDVSEGLVADLDVGAAQSVAKSVGRGKFGAARVDVRDVDLTAGLLQHYDVVVNGVQYYFNLEVMAAALKGGANYLDFGGLYHTTLKQLKLDGKFRSQGLLAIVGMGGMPGITNVLAKHAADSLDKITAIHIRDGARDLTKGVPPFLVTWSLDTFLDELTQDAPIFEEGKTKLVPALSLKERVDFGEPVGRLDTYVTIHSEVATLPESFKDKGIETVDWMEGVPGIEGLKMMVDIGLGSTEEIEVAGAVVSPRKFLQGLIKSRNLIGHPEGLVPNDWEVTQLTAEGWKGGKRATRRYRVTIPPRKDWRMSCAQYGVGIPASIAARMIGRGEVRAKGVLPPEACIDPARFIRQLRAYGFKIKIA